MKLFKVMIPALALAVSAQAEQAQPQQEPADSLLGTRYLEITGGLNRINGIDTAWSSGLQFNAPVAASFDLGLTANWVKASRDFSYGEGYTGTLDMDARVLGVFGTYYLPFSWGKPFATGTAGWAWADVEDGEDYGKVDSFYYDVTAGVEFGFGRWTVAPFAGFQQAVDIEDSETFHGGVKGAFRINDKFHVSAKADILEGEQDFTLGVGLRF